MNRAATVEEIQDMVEHHIMAHGAFDEIISPVVARKQAALIESKVDTLVWREYNMEHEVAPDEMKHVVQFMSAALHG